MNREPFGKQRWLCKHAAGQCGVGHVLLRRKWQTHDKCPRCDADDETVTHVLQCTATTATIEWNEAMLAFEGWLFQVKTSHILALAILQRVEEWRNKIPLQPIQGPRALRDLIRHQDRIGWENFLLGRISEKFATFQQEHFTRARARNTGNVWASKMITQLWKVMYSMWEHRNTINNTTTTKQEQQEQKQLLLQVRREFNQGKKGLVPIDHHLLQDRFEVLSRSLQGLRDWTDRIHNARKHTVRVQKRLRDSQAASRRLMERWSGFTPKTNNLSTFNQQAEE
jgi:hypothetical protein